MSFPHYHLPSSQTRTSPRSDTAVVPAPPVVPSVVTPGERALEARASHLQASLERLEADAELGGNAERVEARVHQLRTNLSQLKVSDEVERRLDKLQGGLAKVRETPFVARSVDALRRRAERVRASADEAPTTGRARCEAFWTEVRDANFARHACADARACTRFSEAEYDRPCYLGDGPRVRQCYLANARYAAAGCSPCVDASQARRLLAEDGPTVQCTAKTAARCCDELTDAELASGSQCLIGRECEASRRPLGGLHDAR